MKTFSKALVAIGVVAMTAATLAPTGVAFAAPPRFEDHGSYGIYNNYRGDREQRPGYRYYNGFWFPPGAFVAGAIAGGLLGGAIAGSTQTYGYTGTPHLTWCEQHYRSYNPATDTYLGYDGQYHYCVSPY